MMTKLHDFNVDGICDVCGLSRRAAIHFKWDCLLRIIESTEDLEHKYIEAVDKTTLDNAVLEAIRILKGG